MFNSTLYRGRDSNGRFISEQVKAAPLMSLEDSLKKAMVPKAQDGKKLTIPTEKPILRDATNYVVNTRNLAKPKSEVQPFDAQNLRNFLEPSFENTSEKLRQSNLAKYRANYESAQDKYTKSFNSPHLYSYDGDEALQLKTGKFNLATVPKRLVDDAVSAAKRAGVDPYVLLGQIGQESTFGGAFKNKGIAKSKRELVSGWNLDEKYHPYEHLRFLADKKAPGVKVVKGRGGWTYNVEDENVLEDYLSKNPGLLNEYIKKNESISRPEDFDEFYEAAQWIKKRGVGSYNPGDKNYERDVLNSSELLRKDPVFTEYMNRLQSPEAQPTQLPPNTSLGNQKLQMGGKVISDNRGQWAHPGKVTRISSGDITMKGVPYPVLGKSNNGLTTVMQPGQNYKFPGAKSVTEYPMMRSGGQFSMGSFAGPTKEPTYFFKYSFGGGRQARQPRYKTASFNSPANLGNQNTQILFNKLRTFENGGNMTFGSKPNRRDLLKKGVDATLYPLPFKKGGKMKLQFGGIAGPMSLIKKVEPPKSPADSLKRTSPLMPPRTMPGQPQPSMSPSKQMVPGTAKPLSPGQKDSLINDWRNKAMNQFDKLNKFESGGQIVWGGSPTQRAKFANGGTIMNKHLGDNFPPKSYKNGGKIKTKFSK